MPSFLQHALQTHAQKNTTVSRLMSREEGGYRGETPVSNIEEFRYSCKQTDILVMPLTGLSHQWNLPVESIPSKGEYRKIICMGEYEYTGRLGRSN